MKVGRGTQYKNLKKWGPPSYAYDTLHILTLEIKQEVINTISTWGNPPHPQNLSPETKPQSICPFLLISY